MFKPIYLPSKIGPCHKSVESKKFMFVKPLLVPRRKPVHFHDHSKKFAIHGVQERNRNIEINISPFNNAQLPLENRRYVELIF